MRGSVDNFRCQKGSESKKLWEALLYGEITLVCSHIRTEHTNTLCGQSVEFLYVKPGGTYCKH